MWRADSIKAFRGSPLDWGPVLLSLLGLVILIDGLDKWKTKVWQLRKWIGRSMTSLTKTTSSKPYIARLGLPRRDVWYTAKPRLALRRQKSTYLWTSGARTSSSQATKRVVTESRIIDSLYVNDFVLLIQTNWMVSYALDCPLTFRSLLFILSLLNFEWKRFLIDDLLNCLIINAFISYFLFIVTQFSSFQFDPPNSVRSDRPNSVRFDLPNSRMAPSSVIRPSNISYMSYGPLYMIHG